MRRPWVGAIVAAIGLTSAARAGAEPPADAPGDGDGSAAPAVVPAPAATDVSITGVATNEVLTVAGSSRGVAEDFMVLPEGLDVGARIRTINADDGAFGPSALKLTDVALADVIAQIAFARHFEADLTLSVLAKQPSTTHENIFQGGSLAIRRTLGETTALAVAGSAAPLIGLDGLAYGTSAAVMYKHRLNRWVAFAVDGGGDAVFVRPADTSSSTLVEAAAHASVLARAPEAWGMWLTVGYAVPVAHSGDDAVSGMPLDPQPRLDVTLGNAVKLADDWDLALEISIVDRGDLAKPATRLPILDGGFDQVQVILAVTRRLHVGEHSQRERAISDHALGL